MRTNTALNRSWSFWAVGIIACSGSTGIPDADSVAEIEWERMELPVGLQVDLGFHSRLYLSGERLLIAPTAHPDEFALVTGNSTRMIRSPGQGPGELSRITAGAIEQHSIFIADASAKIEQFDSGGEYLATFGTRFPADDFSIRGDTLVVVSPSMGPRPGASIRWVLQTGVEVASAELLDFSVPGRIVLLAGDSMDFTVTPSYDIERWSAGRELGQAQRRDLAELPENDRFVSYVKDATLGSGNLLWVLISRRDTTARMRRNDRGGNGDRAPRMLDAEEVSLVHEFFIEVLDLGRSLIIARSLISDGVVGGFLGPGCIYKLDLTSDGVVSLEVLRTHFPQQERGPCDALFN